jgi:hypothetical protein
MNEIFMYGGEKIVEATWRLCEEVFRSETYPEDWARGLIFPIFKGGPKEWTHNPLKYRGITLLSVLGKVYVSVLTERVTKWAESSGILAEEQAGFRKDRSTIDQLFILSEIIKNRRPAKTYACFLDIQKAYDRVWRDGLWEKLHEYGIKGKMWRVLRSVYESVESSVIVNDHRTRFFKVDVGLRQGCLMSPILFALYINGLAEEIRKVDIGARIIARKRHAQRFSSLFFADDIVLIAEEKTNLEALMERAFQYSVKWRFSFNYDKCAVMVFDNKAPQEMVFGPCVAECMCGFHWRLGNHLIRQENSYRYLGMEMDTKLSQKEFRQRIGGKARGNVSKVWGMGMRNGSLSVAASINLYEALVRSILEYGAEVAAPTQWKEAEKIQREMARRILRCHGKTTNEAVLGELGWWRLQTRRDYIKLKYWIKLSVIDDSRLVRQVYKLSREAYETKRKNNWCREIHLLLTKYDLLEYWTDENKVRNPGVDYGSTMKLRVYWERLIFYYVQKKEENDWRQAVSKQPKLRTYCTFKKELKLESYLLSEKDKIGRYGLTSIRVGTNKLRIETGRWKRPIEKAADRVCIQCGSGAVEDERHFVLHCSRFKDMRSEMFEAVEQVSDKKLTNASEEVQWQVLMGGVEKKPGLVSDILKKYVRKALRLRQATH